MKVNINIIYTSILLVLIVFVCIEYHNNNVLESRINSLNKNSIDFSSEKTFKEDFYITQQNRDTTLLLVFFPLFVGIVSFLTYVNITERHINSIEAIKTEAHKNKSEYDSYHKKFVLLETELNFQTGLIYSERASSWIKNIITLMVGLLSVLVAFKSDKTECEFTHLLFLLTLILLGLSVLSGVVFLYSIIDRLKRKEIFHSESLNKRLRGNNDVFEISIVDKKIFVIFSWFFYISSVTSVISLICYGIIKN